MIDSSQTESQIVVLPYLPTSEPIVYVYKVKKEGEVYYAISFGLIEQASRISMQNARLYTSFEESKKALLFYDKDHFKRYLEKGNYKIMPILRMTHVPFRFIEYQQIEELSQKEKADLRSLLNWRDEPLKK